MASTSDRTAGEWSRRSLRSKFKNAADPFRLAFVCSMWTTGFDVPSLSTVYLDKPLRNHTLMQTITRANRVFPEKNNGLIVAYVDVFRNLQRLWRSTRWVARRARCPSRRRDSWWKRPEKPSMISELSAWRRDVDLDALGRLKGFELVAAGKEAVEMLMVDDDERDRLHLRVPHWSIASTRRSCPTSAPTSSVAYGPWPSSSPTASRPTSSHPISQGSWVESSNSSTSPSRRTST